MQPTIWVEGTKVTWSHTQTASYRNAVEVIHDVYMFWAGTPELEARDQEKEAQWICG